MKSKGNLYPKIYSMNNLIKAYKKARKRKTKRHAIIEFEKDLVDNLENLQKSLISKTYQPSPMKRFIVQDPKSRVIHASEFQDRIIHHALINIIGPIFERTFIHDSYASRVGKGTRNAIKKFDKFKWKTSRNGRVIHNEINKNKVVGYVLKADIRKYFDEVDHSILIKTIQRKIKDGDVIFLIRKILMNFYSSTEGRGMPLGNYTSQFFANVYLNRLDHFIKHQLKANYYIRYVDDFIIFNRDKKELQEYESKISHYLSKIKLSFHKDKSKIIPLKNGISFLGIRIFYFNNP